MGVSVGRQEASAPPPTAATAAGRLRGLRLCPDDLAPSSHLSGTPDGARECAGPSGGSILKTCSRGAQSYRGAAMVWLGATV